MFDYIECSYPLPITDEIKNELGKQEWDKIKFKTKSFHDSFCENYSIEDDGQIYKEIIDRYLVEGEDGQVELKEKNLGIEKIDWTGEVSFYYDFFRE